jgi:hypothetical protein
MHYDLDVLWFLQLLRQNRAQFYDIGNDLFLTCCLSSPLYNSRSCTSLVTKQMNYKDLHSYWLHACAIEIVLAKYWPPLVFGAPQEVHLFFRTSMNLGTNLLFSVRFYFLLLLVNLPTRWLSFELLRWWQCHHLVCSVLYVREDRYTGLEKNKAFNLY